MYIRREIRTKLLTENHIITVFLSLMTGLHLSSHFDPLNSKLTVTTNTGDDKFQLSVCLCWEVHWTLLKQSPVWPMWVGPERAGEMACSQHGEQHLRLGASLKQEGSTHLYRHPHFQLSSSPWTGTSEVVSPKQRSRTGALEEGNVCLYQ